MGERERERDCMYMYDKEGRNERGRGRKGGREGGREGGKEREMQF